MLVNVLMIGAAAGLLLATIAQIVVMFLHGYEHARYHRVRAQSQIDPDFQPTVVLISPCRGTDLHQEQQLLALFEQNYLRYELCFVVESDAEPVLSLIARLSQDHPGIACRIVVAGLATDCGQKVHNLTAALRALRGQPEVVAFVDSDARPSQDWLRKLIDRLRGERAVVSTSFRWFVPTRRTLPNLLVAGVNNSLCTLAGLNRYNLIWGGAWAARYEVLQCLMLPDRWSGCLNDDLRTSTLAQQAGVRIVYEPGCLVASPVDLGWTGLFEFLRRQYLQLRIYAPRHWLATVVASGISSLAICILLTSAILAPPAWLRVTCLAGLSAFYLLGWMRLRIGVQAIRPFLRRSDLQDTIGVLPFLVFAWPLVSLTALCGAIAGAIGREIIWRGIHYRIESATETTILARDGVAVAPTKSGRYATATASDNGTGADDEENRLLRAQTESEPAGSFGWRICPRQSARLRSPHFLTRHCASGRPSGREG